MPDTIARLDDPVEGTAENTPTSEVSKAPFSLVPVDKADEEDLETRGIEWIKDKLRDAANYIPNVHVIKRILESNESYTDEEFFALLAYRCLKDLVEQNMQRVSAAQAAERTVQVPDRNIIIPGRNNNG